MKQNNKIKLYKACEGYGERSWKTLYLKGCLCIERITLNANLCGRQNNILSIFNIYLFGKRIWHWEIERIKNGGVFNL